MAKLLLIACALVACALANSEEKYSNRYDSIDEDAILANDRLRAQYVKCITDAGPCRTPDAVFLKEHFPEAIVTKCRKCTDRQRVIFDKVVTWFTENDPAEWENIMKTAVANYTMKGALRRQQEKSGAKERAEKTQ